MLKVYCKVSLIVPVYNVEKYIERCIQSILAQSMTEFECLLIDDASPDNSIGVVRALIQNDSRFRIIRHAQNKGLGPARNTGIDHAIADYICFLDSDDTIEPDYLKLLYAAIVEHSARMAVCNIYNVSHKNKKTLVQNLEAKNLYHAIQNILLLRDRGAAWSRMYTKNLFNTVKFPRGYYEDGGTIFSLIAHNAIDKIPQICDPIYNYFQNEASITHTVSPRHIYYIFCNLLHPIISNICTAEHVHKHNTALCTYVFAKLSITLLTIYASSQCIVQELIFLKRMIKRFIPPQVLHGIQLKNIVLKALCRTLGAKQVCKYIVIYYSNLKFGPLSTVLAMLFQKFYKYAR